MAQVHTFSITTDLFSDTRLPLQYRGGGNPPGARQVEMSTLLEFIAAQLGVGTEVQTVEDEDTIEVSGGNLITCLAVEAASGSRTIKVGTTAGGDELIEETTIPTDTDYTFTLNRYTSTTLTMYFTLTGGNADVLVFKLSKLA